MPLQFIAWSLLVSPGGRRATPFAATGNLPRPCSYRCDTALPYPDAGTARSEEHTSELQSPCNLVCRLLLEKKKHDNRFVLVSRIQVSSFYSLYPICCY